MLVTWLLFGNWSEGSRGPRSDGNINHYESKLKCFVSWILPLGLGLDKYDTRNPLMRRININLDFLRRLLIIIFSGGDSVSAWRSIGSQEDSDLLEHPWIHMLIRYIYSNKHVDITVMVNSWFWFVKRCWCISYENIPAGCWVLGWCFVGRGITKKLRHCRHE